MRVLRLAFCLRLGIGVVVCTHMNTTATFSVRVERSVKKKLEKLARSTGRSRAFLAAEAIHEYLDVNDWQVAGIKRAIASLESGKSVSHDNVKKWVSSWGSKRERVMPTLA